jgi:23S rRNA (uracil1939-C5)-methyltransferase
MRKNDIIEETITSLGYGGEGVSRKSQGTLFVPRTTPGDRVRVRIRQVKERYAHGELMDILKPSDQRVPSRCVSYEHGCGGCQWLHIQYEEQLRWKTRLLKDTLKFKGNMTFPVMDTIGMKDPYQCRNKLSLLNRDGDLVFMQENSDRSIRLDRCNQETLPNQKVYDRIRKIDLPEEILQVHLRSASDGSVGVCLFIKKMSMNVNRVCNRIMKENPEVKGIGVSGYRDYHTVAGKDFLEQKMKGLTFRIPLNGFFQTNYEQAQVMQDLLVKAAGAGKNDNILDLYCGAGFFSLPLAANFKTVTGVENHPESIRNAASNASLNRIQNARFAVADAGNFLKDQKPGFYQAIVLDPPRSGCDPAVLAELLRLRPRKIIYISCSPESLARDLSALTKNLYAVKLCRPVDMFPHTYHIETLVVLDYEVHAVEPMDKKPVTDEDEIPEQNIDKFKKPLEHGKKEFNNTKSRHRR